MFCNRLYVSFFFVKQKTAYEMRISDWSSDVCSSDLTRTLSRERAKDMASDYPRDRDAEIRAFADRRGLSGEIRLPERAERSPVEILGPRAGTMRQMGEDPRRSEEHTSELQSLMRISYAGFCLNKKKRKYKQSD